MDDPLVPVRDPAKDTWVERVLGVSPSAFAPGPGPASPSAALLPVWQAAESAVDDQLGVLSNRLRETDIPALVGVADEVENLLDEVRFTMLEALPDYDVAPTGPETRKAAVSAIATASDWLGDERVKAVDNNSFGVAVSAATTLGGALRQLQRELAGKAGATA